MGERKARGRRGAVAPGESSAPVQRADEAKVASRRTQAPLRMSRGQFKALGGLCGTIVCEDADPGACRETSGRWKAGPALEKMSVELDSIVGLDVLLKLDFVPVGFKTWLRFAVSAEITGRLECSCDNGVDHGWSDKQLRFPVRVFVRVPVPVQIVRFGGPIATGAEIVYRLNELNETLDRYRKWFAPALRTVRESATLICQGRFDPKGLARHLGEIMLDLGHKRAGPLLR